MNTDPVPARRGTAGRGRAQPAETKVYGGLERCRIWCEQLRREDPSMQALRRVHRELGLAGYHASHALPCGVRQQTLAAAHEACSSNQGIDASLGALERELDRSVKDLHGAIQSAPDADHLHLAQRHALSAQDALRRPRAVVRAAPAI
jgi:hypothetical protein